MKVKELYARLEERVPRSLSCEWDNDGLMCCPDSNREVKRALIALDVTSAVANKAAQEGYDLVISHHPFIFNGVKTMDDEGALSAKVMKLVKSDTAVMSFHTRLDAVEGGVNDKLAQIFGLKNVEPLMGEGLPLGRIGELDAEMSAEEFALTVKEKLSTPVVIFSDTDIPVRRVAVLGGGGGSFIGAARAAGADSYISGRLDFHALTDARDYIVGKPMNLFEAGHFYTEHPVCEVIKQFVNAIDPSIECDIISSNPIKTV